VARTRTLAEMRAEVRQRADIENSEHVSDTEINRYLNQSWARLWNKVTQLDPVTFMDMQHVVTSAGVQEYELFPFWRIADAGVLRMNASFREAVRMNRMRPEEMALFANEDGGPPRVYRVYASDGSDQLQVFPAPDGVYQIRVHFIPPPQQLLEDTQSFDGRAGWEEYVVLDATIKCLLKEESDASAHASEREALWVDIMAAVRTPDISSPDVVQDTAGGFDEEWL
jgi:hypothetical protein